MGTSISEKMSEGAGKGGEHHTDALENFTTSIEEKYKEEDQADVDRADAAEAEDDAEDRGAGKSKKSAKGKTKEEGSDEGSDEDAESDTSDDPDGEESETDDDSDADADAEDTDADADDADGEESDDADADDAGDAEADADAEDDEDKKSKSKGKTDADEEDDDADVEGDDDAKAVLAAAGADTKLEDVPKEYRSIIDKKLKSIDSVFSRVNQERTKFRQERAAMIAEEKFRADHSELYFAEALRADPGLMAKVNAELDKIDGEDVDEKDKPEREKALHKLVSDKRREARDATDRAYEAHLAKVQKASERGEYVSNLLEKLSSKYEVPYRIVEKEALKRLAELKADGKDMDIPDDELLQLVKDEAREHKRTERKGARTSSKERIKARTDGKRRVAPGSKAHGDAPPAKPKDKKKQVVDSNNEESRIRAMMRTARRVLPGVQDS